MKWLETCSKQNRSERERWWIENTLNTVNNRLPGRTRIEIDAKYHQEHKEEKKEYRQKNIKKIKEKFDCECGGKYTYASKARHFTKCKKHTNWVLETTPVATPN